MYWIDLLIAFWLGTVAGFALTCLIVAGRER